MDDLTKVMAKEKLALLNREIEILEKERDDLLYNYRLLKDKIHHLKRRMIPRLLIIGVCLVINRGIRIRQITEMYKHTGESWGSPPPTIIDYIRDFLTHPDLLFFLFIILGIYSIFLGVKFYAMFAKTEHSVVPVRIAGIINVRNYSMELSNTEAKTRKCDLELQKLKNEADQVLDLFGNMHYNNQRSYVYEKSDLRNLRR